MRKDTHTCLFTSFRSKNAIEYVRHHDLVQNYASWPRPVEFLCVVG